MASSIASAKACAQTMLFQNLAINDFTGAVPHVVLVVDKHPSVLQKVLVEGYLRAMEEYNSHCDLSSSHTLPQISECQNFTHHNSINNNSNINNKVCKGHVNKELADNLVNEFTQVLKSDDCATNGELFIPLDSKVDTPCGSLGLSEAFADEMHNCTNETNLHKHCRITCSILPFDAVTFLDEMRRLQCFLRLCGLKCQHQSNENTSHGVNKGNVNSTQKNDNSNHIESVASNAKPNNIASPLNEDNNSSGAKRINVQEFTANKANMEHDTFFAEEFNHLTYLLKPLSTIPHDDDDDQRKTNNSAILESLRDTLQTGPLRELLGFILLQQSAFQNEMKKYRLRLNLFDMGMRVAEHCHLESMSAHADALALQHDYKKALEDDQIYTYGRSCALEPRKVEILARAIADAIDVFAWKRVLSNHNSDNETTTTTTTTTTTKTSTAAGASTLALPPPESLIAAWNEEALWQWFDEKSLCWSNYDNFAFKGNISNEKNEQKNCQKLVMNDYLARPIIGPGEPLHIICKNANKVLTFTGGLEDCLMNTGFYVATTSNDRNNVNAHRRRFIVHDDLRQPHITINDECRVELKTHNTAQGHSEDATIDDNKNINVVNNIKGVKTQTQYGRMKKQDYLALKKAHKLNGKNTVDNSSSNNNNSNIINTTAKESDAAYHNIDEQKVEKTKFTCASTHKMGSKDKRDNDSDAEEQTENATRESRGAEDSVNTAGSCINSSIGGTFPIGEVITEAFDLSQLNGVCDVFAFPDPDKNVAMCKPAPFEMVIENGVVTSISENAPMDMHELLSLVRQAEDNKCYIRELGIGLNPFVGLQHMLADVTSFERQWGIHLSLGLRHPLFVKQRIKRNRDGSKCDDVVIKGPIVKRKAGKYHIDVFIDAAFLKIGSFTIDFTCPLKVR